MCLFLLRSDFGLHVNVGLELRTADRAAARRLSQSLPGTDFVHQCVFLWSVSAVPNWYTRILDRLVVVPSIRNLKHACCIYACIRVFVFVIYILRHTDQGSGEYHVHLSTSLMTSSCSTRRNARVLFLILGGCACRHPALHERRLTR